MKQAEAKQKWCPQALVTRGSRPSGTRLEIKLGEAAFNRVENGDEVIIPPASLCLASGCMFWRWEKDRDPALETIEWDGHCGLARWPAPEAAVEWPVKPEASETEGGE